jgi:FG-GAP repeat
MRKSSITACLLALVSLLGTGPARAQEPPFDLVRTFRNPNPSVDAEFGYSVALVGSNVLVGAPFDDAAGTNAGAAYLFDGATGQLLRTFQSPNPAAGDWFGLAVAAVGNNVLVGALGDDAEIHDGGAAFLFDGATGALLRTFRKPNPTEADWFGGAVAAMGNNVLIGAPLDHASGKEAGAAYLFDGSTGALLHTFQKKTPAAGDWFGVSLAAAGNRVLVGAMQDDTKGKDAGAVYLFDGATGDLLQSIPTDVNAGPGDWFGVSVAAVGANFVVGAPLNDSGFSDAGGASVLDGTTGGHLKSLSNPMPMAGDNFGRSVAAIGTTVLIGAPGTREIGPGGAVWPMDSTAGVNLSSALQNPARTAGDNFGFALAANGPLLLVGAPMADAGETDSGAVYLYRAR